MTISILYKKSIPRIGTFHIRPYHADMDLPVIHAWVNQPYAKYWGLLESDKEQVCKTYEDIIAFGTKVFIGELAGKQAFLLEQYDAAHDLGKHYEARPGDTGMHILTGPPEKPVHGFTWEVFSTVMDFLFSDTTVQRVIVEPDARNEKIHVLNRKAGFEYQKLIELPHKTAYLAICSRTGYEQALLELSRQKQNI